MGQCHSQNIIHVMCLSHFICFAALVMERHTGPRCLALKKLLNAHLTTCSFRTVDVSEKVKSNVLNSSSDDILHRSQVLATWAWVGIIDRLVRSVHGSIVRSRRCGGSYKQRLQYGVCSIQFCFPSEGPSYRGPNRAMKSPNVLPARIVLTVASLEPLWGVCMGCAYTSR